MRKKIVMAEKKYKKYNYFDWNYLHLETEVRSLCHSLCLVQAY